MILVALVFGLTTGGVLAAIAGAVGVAVPRNATVRKLREERAAEQSSAGTDMNASSVVRSINQYADATAIKGSGVRSLAGDTDTDGAERVGANRN